MIVRSLVQLLGTDRDVQGDVWNSRRFLTASDGVGFTLTETTVSKGAEQVLWYKDCLRASTDMRLVCVFTPALTGRQTHDEDGSYMLPA